MQIGFGLPRAFLAGVIICFIFFLGCSSESTEPAVQTMISEVGELDQEGDLPLYRYEGVLFYGDIPLDEFEAAREVVLSLLVEGETLISVRNYRVYPDDGWIQFPRDSFDLGTCREWGSPLCVRGMQHRFTITGDQVVLVESSEWTTDP